MRTLMSSLIVLGLGCSTEPDRKPANAPGAPKLEQVLHDAGDVTTRPGHHHSGAVAGEGAAAGIGAGAAVGGRAGIIPPPVDAGQADAGAPPDSGGR